jgi:hypothetical protein
MKPSREILDQFYDMQDEFFEAEEDGKDTTELFKKLVAFAYKHGIGQFLDDPDDLPNVENKTAREPSVKTP